MRTSSQRACTVGGSALYCTDEHRRPVVLQPSTTCSVSSFNLLYLYIQFPIYHSLLSDLNCTKLTKTRTVESKNKQMSLQPFQLVFTKSFTVTSHENMVYRQRIQCNYKQLSTVYNQTLIVSFIYGLFYNTICIYATCTIDTQKHSTVNTSSKLTS